MKSETPKINLVEKNQDNISRTTITFYAAYSSNNPLQYFPPSVAHFFVDHVISERITRKDAMV